MKDIWKFCLLNIRHAYWRGSISRNFIQCQPWDRGVRSNWQSGSPASCPGCPADEGSFLQRWQWGHLNRQQLTQTKIRTHDPTPLFLVWKKSLSSFFLSRWMQQYLRRASMLTRLWAEPCKWGRPHARGHRARGPGSHHGHSGELKGRQRDKGAHFGLKRLMDQCAKRLSQRSGCSEVV